MVNHSILEPNQIMYKVTRGEIVKDSILYRINSHGQNSSDYSFKKDDDEIRIIFMGGSHIFDQEFHHFKGGPFTELIMSKFKNKNIRIINAGIPGYNMSHIYNRIKYDILRLDPDIVILNSIWNDIKVINRYDQKKTFKNNSSNKPKKNPLIHSMNQYDEIFGWSVVYRKIRDYYWMKRFRINFNKELTEKILISENEEYQGNIELGLKMHYFELLDKSIKLLKQNGALPILAIEERLVNSNNTDLEKRKIKYQMAKVKSHDELVSLFNKCDSILYQIAEKEDLILFDVNSLMPKNLEYFTDHVHTTEMGSRFMAVQYFKLLESLLEKER